MCVEEITVRVDKGIYIFVSEYRRGNKTQQRVQLQQVVLYWSACQQQAMIKSHLNTNKTQQ